VIDLLYREEILQARRMPSEENCLNATDGAA
jgi:hypothetical protein